jgi:hypothetical protein
MNRISLTALHLMLVFILYAGDSPAASTARRCGLRKNLAAPADPRLALSIRIAEAGNNEGRKRLYRSLARKTRIRSLQPPRIDQRNDPFRIDSRVNRDGKKSVHTERLVHKP